MNNPNASSLFHFTSSFEILKAIIRDGIRFSYSYEEHDFTDVPEDECPEFKGVAFPMICFCNTPLSRAENHARVYGKYHLAFDKEFLLSIYNSILNPVIYYSSNNLARSIFCLEETRSNLQSLFLQSLAKYSQDATLAKTIVDFTSSDLNFDDKFKRLPYQIRHDIQVINNFAFASNFILGLAKPIYGKNKLGEMTFLDEEREWRAFMIDRFDENIRWRFYQSKDEFDAKKDELNRIILKYDNSYLTIPTIEWSNMITSICVEYESQIPELVNYILSTDKLFGYKITNETNYIRSFIISRITSFERISQDI